MITRLRQIVVGVIFGAALFGAPADPAAARELLPDWATIEHERLGFRIAYPLEVFQQRATQTDEDGRVLVSRDGRARLVVGAFENSENISVSDYRHYILRENYAGARVTFAPVYRHWFIVSGYRDGQVFYQRVSFSCGGRMISSWAMLYPANQKHFYDRVVEKIARTFSPGSGKTGECD